MRQAVCVPFDETHIPGAAGLLAERHAAHRCLEPLLPNVADFEQQVANEFAGATGAAALVGADVVGYLIGKRQEDPLGPHVWSGIAGQATREPELVRDLYAEAATTWVADGLMRHFVFVPATAELLDPWFRLSFGASAALAVRETTASDANQVPPDVFVRRSTPDDLPAVADLAGVLDTQLGSPPSFNGRSALTAEQLKEEWSDTWTDDRYVHFVAERDGRVVGHALLYRRPAGDLRVGTNSIDLGNASTEPSVRGTGVGVAMTAHVLTWAREHEFAAMTTDWRMTNLLACRFWPRRGFREVFLRLYRSLP
jgi:GNAT superfamily N-acetyltransferase